MVLQSQALEQVLRFEHYAGFPHATDRAADRQELVRAFQSCRDAAHARAAGDWLIRNRPVPDCRFAPVPAEIYAAAQATAPKITEATRRRMAGDEDFGGLADLITPEIREKLERMRSHSDSGMTVLAAIVERAG